MRRFTEEKQKQFYHALSARVCSLRKHGTLTQTETLLLTQSGNRRIVPFPVYSSLKSPPVSSGLPDSADIQQFLNTVLNGLDTSGKYW